MALGGQRHITVMIEPTEALRHLVESTGSDSSLLRVYRCEIPIPDRTLWEIEDYEAMALVMLSYELVDTLPEALLSDLLGPEPLTCSQLENYWRIEHLRFDERLGADDVTNASGSELDKLPKTRSSKVNAYFDELRIRARASRS